MKNNKLIKAILIAMLAISTLQGADTNTTRADDNKTTTISKNNAATSTSENNTTKTEETHFWRDLTDTRQKKFDLATLIITIMTIGIFL